MADENPFVRRAVRIYEFLLWLYPRPHREEYGPQMVQLFRDQCRDACLHGKRGAWFALWGGTLVDVACSAFREQLTEQTNHMKNTPSEKPTSKAIQDEFARTCEVMSERDRQVAHLFFAVVALLYVLLGVGFLLNALQAEPMPLRQKWLGAGASFLIPAICWSWRHLSAFLPVLPARRKRLALVVLSTVGGGLCTAALVHFIPTGVMEPRGAHAGTLLWTFLPLVIGITFIFGLEDAAYRKHTGASL